MIHLDTSFLIHSLLAGSPEDSMLRTWLADGASLAMSAIAWTEFLCGPVSPDHVDLASAVISARVPHTDVLASSAANCSTTRAGAGAPWPTA